MHHRCRAAAVRAYLRVTKGLSRRRASTVAILTGRRRALGRTSNPRFAGDPVVFGRDSAAGGARSTRRPPLALLPHPRTPALLSRAVASAHTAHGSGQRHRSAQSPTQWVATHRERERRRHAPLSLPPCQRCPPKAPSPAPELVAARPLAAAPAGPSRTLPVLTVQQCAPTRDRFRVRFPVPWNRSGMMSKSTMSNGPSDPDFRSTKSVAAILAMR